MTNKNPASVDVSSYSIVDALHEFCTEKMVIRVERVEGRPGVRREILNDSYRLSRAWAELQSIHSAGNVLLSFLRDPSSEDRETMPPQSLTHYKIEDLLNSVVVGPNGVLLYDCRFSFPNMVETAMEKITAEMLIADYERKVLNGNSVHDLSDKVAVITDNIHDWALLNHPGWQGSRDTISRKIYLEKEE